MSDSRELDYSRPLDCDVVVAGAGLAGLVTAAVLSRRGYRVVVVDGASRIGGRGGGTPHRGYWIDGGQRSGRDVTDLQIGWRYGQEAAREADVEIPLRAVQPTLRVHLLLDSSARDANVVEGDWSASGFAALARDAFGCPPALLTDFTKILQQLASASAEERRAALSISLGSWLPKAVSQEPLRRALRAMVTVIYCEHPERASLGRIMDFLAAQRSSPPLIAAYADDDEAGGMQGLMEPWARALEERGGRIVLAHEPLEVLFDGARARGLLAASEGHLALEIRALHTVVAYPLWQALPLVPSERIPPELVALAQQLEDEQADATGWVAGLRRLPILRASGVPESRVGWNRVLVGEERRFLGGFQIPSLGSRRQAPAGRHLLHVFLARWLRRDERAGWAQARRHLDILIAYLQRFYSDLDECIEWSAFQAVQRPALFAWYWAPIERHGVRFPSIDQLYLASTTIESDAGPVDIAAQAGLEAARAILADSRAP